ncbi:MAG: DUF167 domain-containing protein [Candidatus Pacebacteria bacterium]|nr:DUF167 domain-containing protein [Candidatus Paceibacterota bacterium]
MRVRVKVTAGAHREKVVEHDAVTFDMYVKEPPQGGMANKRVMRLLAERFGVDLRAVRMETGYQSRNKTFSIHGIQ